MLTMCSAKSNQFSPLYAYNVTRNAFAVNGDVVDNVDDLCP
jgi:hypothetical protein